MDSAPNPKIGTNSERYDSDKKAENKKSSRPGSEKYCICDNDDYTVFMICCDFCEMWYHGGCVNVSKSDSKKIEKFSCTTCHTKNPECKTVYKQSKKHKITAEDKAPFTQAAQILRCGNCIGCIRTADCGKCENCLTKKSLCRDRVCVQSAELNKKTSDATSETGRARIDENKKLFKKASHRCDSLDNTQHDARSTKPLKEDNYSSSINAQLASIYNTYTNTKEYQAEQMQCAKQCYGPECVNSARIGSNYCSDECGLALAEKRLRVILPQKVLMYFEQTPAEEKNDIERMEHLQKEMVQLQNELNLLDTFQENVKKFIAAIRTAIPLTKTEPNGDENFVLNCAVCSGEFSIKDITRHTQSCFVRTERQSTFATNSKLPMNPMNLVCDAFNKTNKTYCKRLRVICSEHYKDDNEIKICGCPLAWYKGRGLDFREMFLSPEEIVSNSDCCREKRKHCLNHQNWAQTALALIDNERMNLLNKIDEDAEKHRQIQRQKNSRGDVISLLCTNVEKYPILSHQIKDEVKQE